MNNKELYENIVRYNIALKDMYSELSKELNEDTFKLKRYIQDQFFSTTPSEDIKKEYKELKRFYDIVFS